MDRALIADIPKDGDATLERARREAAARMRLGEDRVFICQHYLKLPSGITGTRYYCLSEEIARIFQVREPKLVEVVTRRKPRGKGTKEGQSPRGEP